MRARFKVRSLFRISFWVSLGVMVRVNVTFELRVRVRS